MSRLGLAVSKIIVGALLVLAEPGGAQIAALPPAVQSLLKETGPNWGIALDENIARTIQAFDPVLRAAPKAGVRVIRDLSYGPNPRNRLDIFRKSGRPGRPVVLFVYGGAYTRGDRNVTPYAYSNVGTYFARQGFIGVTMSYRLAPAAQWPSGAEDVAAAVAWLKANVVQYGGDPAQIVLIGQSAGATHAASYAMIPSLQPAGDPGLKGLVLLSGRYRIESRPGDPRSRNVEAYFGTNSTLYPERSPMSYVDMAPRVPTFVVIAEYDNPGLDVQGAQLFAALCVRDEQCPRFLRLAGHNHSSMMQHFNTADQKLGKEIVAFINEQR